MGKRRAVKDSDEEDEFQEEGSASEQEEEEEVPVKKSRSNQKSKAKPKSAEKTPERTAKKPRLGSDDDDDASALRTDKDGSKYLDLGKRRRATVRDFKGTAFLDIREFYEQGGEEKPGKKGISITQEQWNVLRGNSATVDALFAKMKKK